MTFWSSQERVHIERVSLRAEYARGPNTCGKLRAAGLAPSAASPHLKLLRETGLMHARVDARRRLYGDVVSGRYVEVVPNRRVVFTFGWERPDVEVPPGSTTVEIDLRPTNTGTELHLVHPGLPGPMADAHAGGWDNYLRPLADVAAGLDPGPDALARERMNTDSTPGEARFWELAQPLVEQTGVTRSTMMGFPCLRLHGDFFATCDRRTGDLVVKLDESQVTRLIDSGKAEALAPNGRRFREWTATPYAQRRTWGRHLDAALTAAAERLAQTTSRSNRPRRSG